MKNITPFIVLTFLSVTQIQAQKQNLSGVWQFNLGDGDIFQRVTLQHRGDSLTGTFFGQRFTARMKGGNLKFSIGSDFQYIAAIRNDTTLTGTFTDRDSTVTQWSARKEKANSKPTSKVFKPQRYYRAFSADETPCLFINSGDTIATTTIDASGTDQYSKKANWGGNPLTGPFFVEDAMPGDVLAIKFVRIRPNRAWAFSGRELVESVLEADYLKQNGGDRIDNAWQINEDSGFLKMYQPPQRLQHYRIPLRPFLGCVGVAPPARAAVSSQLSGRFGGNMDDNFLKEGTTLYLPVFAPGAHLFIGDAHAAQGDGEVSGSAMETSMDVVFTVTLLKGGGIATPQMEDATYIRAVGIAGSLDKAVKIATTSLARWIEQQYGLTKAELTPLLGFSLEYEIPDMVGESISVAAKIKKEVLAMLPAK